MDLSFYKNLNPTQKDFADRIAAKAKEMGIPPELAVSVAFQESGLNPQVGKGAAGEIGIMQIKPTTAKEMGFSLEDLADPMKNIEAGLSYLKKSYDLSEGNPKLAAAGYNAGVNHPFFSSKDQTLPDTTVKYLKNLNTFGAFTGVSEKKPVEFQEPPPSQESVNLQQEIDKVDEQIARGKGQLIGGALGAAETARRAAVPAARGAARFLGSAMEEGRLAAEAKAAAQKPPIGGTMAPGLASESTSMNRILQGTTDDAGTTGRARMQGFNVETAQQAAKAKEAARNIGVLQRQGLVAQGVPDPFAKGPGMTSSPSGVVYPRTPPMVKKVPKTGLDQVTELFRKMIEPGSKIRTGGEFLTKYGGPPLAGLQVGREVGSMSQELGKEQPDYLKAGLSGLSALGAGMSVFPTTAPVGIPLAITAPLIQYLRETKSERPEGQISDIAAP